jgi:hypothetical protein
MRADKRENTKMSKPIEAIMQKEMSRQEFMLTLGLGLTSVLGFGRIIELLTGHSFKNNVASHASYGYSSGSYGGATEAGKKQTA